MITIVGGDLYQWDTGRKIQITSGYQWVDFRNFGCYQAKRVLVNATSNEVTIPNSTLTKAGTCTVYVGKTNNDGTTVTVVEEKIKIHGRAKPIGYRYDDDDFLNWEKLNDIVVENAGARVQQYEAAAKAEIEQAENRILNEIATAEGELEDYVTAASGHATTASGYASAASSSASSASTSATNAETAKTAAETAKTGAETAASNLITNIQTNYPTYAQVATELASQKQDIADIIIKSQEYSEITYESLLETGSYIDDAYIRESSASYPGRISSTSKTSRVYWFSVSANANMYFDVPNTSTWRVRVSNEVPAIGNSLPFTGTQWDPYSSNSVPTVDNPYTVTAGQYIAFNKTTTKLPSDIKIYVQDQVETDLNPELPTIASLTASVNSEASAISALNNDNIFPYCFDKVICIGDSLTAGSCYRSDGTHIGNIDQNYPYQLGRMLNTNVINAGHSGRTVKSWYTAHMGDAPDQDYTKANAVIIFLGTNNAGTDLMTDTIYDDAPEGVSYTEYADTQTGYYCRLIAHILSINPYLRITLVNIFGSSDGMDTNRAVIRKLATRYGLQCIETYNEFASAKHPEYHGANGNIHLNKIGYIALAHHIYKALAQWIPDDLTRANFGVTLNGTPMRS